MIFLFVLTLLQVQVPDAQQFVGPPKGLPINGAQLDRRTNEVASLLRCPVCQGLSVADSPSTMAQDMKQQVRELLGRGFTQEQILAYFERSYGQFVLLKPKFQGVAARFIQCVSIQHHLRAEAARAFHLDARREPRHHDHRAQPQPVKRPT